MSNKRDELMKLIMLSLISEAGFALRNGDSYLIRRDINAYSIIQLIPAEKGSVDNILSRYVDYSEKVGIEKEESAFFRHVILVLNDDEETEGLNEKLTLAYKAGRKKGLVGYICAVKPGATDIILPDGVKIKDKRVKQSIEKSISACNEGENAEMIVEKRASRIMAEEKAFREGIRKPKLINPSTILMAINIVIFIAGLVLEIRDGTNAIVNMGIQDNALIAAGEYWRLFTPMFLHASFAHLAGNMMSLYLLGAIALKYYSDGEFLLIYTVSGLLGNILSFFFTDYLSLGASGAIMGLGGMLIFRMFFDKNAKSFRKFGNYASLAFMVVFNLMFGIFAASANINNYGHFGGFIGGFIVAFIISRVKAKSGK